MRNRKQRGDTLVEVTFAVVILSAVIVSAFFLAGRALRQQQSAKERTQAANIQQEQAEGLRNLRDNSGFSALRNALNEPGNSYLRLPKEPNAPVVECSADSERKFYLELEGDEWAILNGIKQSGFYETCIRVYRTSQLDKLQFEIVTAWDPQGGGSRNMTSLTTYLVNTSR